MCVGLLRLLRLQLAGRQESLARRCRVALLAKEVVAKGLHLLDGVWMRLESRLRGLVRCRALRGIRILALRVALVLRERSVGPRLVLLLGAGASAALGSFLLGHLKVISMLVLLGAEGARVVVRDWDRKLPHLAPRVETKLTAAILQIRLLVVLAGDS